MIFFALTLATSQNGGDFRILHSEVPRRSGVSCRKAWRSPSSCHGLSASHDRKTASVTGVTHTDRRDDRRHASVTLAPSEQPAFLLAATTGCDVFLDCPLPRP